MSLLAFSGLLFAPAGSLHFWQGWLYGFVFAASTTAISIYLLKHDPKLVERRMKAGPAAEQRPVAENHHGDHSGGLHFADRPARFRLRWHWSAVPTWLVLAANAVLALSFVHLFHRAQTEQLRGIDDQGRGGPTGRLNRPLCNRQASALLGRACYCFSATPLALGSYWGCWSLFALIPVLLWRLLDEERFLKQNLPGYAEYCHATRFQTDPPDLVARALPARPQIALRGKPSR